MVLKVRSWFVLFAWFLRDEFIALMASQLLVVSLCCGDLLSESEITLGFVRSQGKVGS